MPPPRILHIGTVPDSIAGTVARAAGLGFDSVLFTPLPESGPGNDPANGAVQGLAEECRANGLALFADLDPYVLDLHHPLVEEHPECFALRRNGEGHVVDPRHPVPGQGQALLRGQADPEPLLAWWSAVIAAYREAGVTGFRARHPGTCGPALWRALIDAARDGNGTLTFIADTPGERREDVAALAECGFDYTLSSLPWWDGRASWFVEEHALLSAVAPVIAAVDAPEKLPPATTALRRARLAIAALTGTGLMMPQGFELPADGEDAEALAACIRAANAAVAHDGGRDCLTQVTGPGAPITIILRADGPDLRNADRATTAFVNPDPTLAVEIRPDDLCALGEFGDLKALDGFGGEAGHLRPGETQLYAARRRPAVKTRPSAREKGGMDAVKAPRVVVTNMSPQIDEGFAVKAIAGERVAVEADIFADGHPVLAAELLYRAEDERKWQRVRMHPAENDRWAAHLPLTRMGRHRFAIEAWIDDYGSFVHDLIKKRDAGQALALEIAEGRALMEATKTSANGAPAQALGCDPRRLRRAGRCQPCRAADRAGNHRDHAPRGNTAACHAKPAGLYRCRTARGALCELVRTVPAFTNRRPGTARHAARRDP